MLLLQRAEKSGAKKEDRSRERHVGTLEYYATERPFVAATLYGKTFAPCASAASVAPSVFCPMIPACSGRRGDDAGSTAPPRPAITYESGPVGETSAAAPPTQEDAKSPGKCVLGVGGFGEMGACWRDGRNCACIAG